MHYSAEAESYSNALDLIKALKENNIQANITAGGVCISIQEDQLNILKYICSKYNANCFPGATQHQNNIN